MTKPADHSSQTRLSVARLSHSAPTAFDLVPDAATRKALAEAMGVEAIRKLRFAGTVTPKGRRAFELEATLGTTVVQSCVVTLDPVTTRIDTDVVRRFVPEDQIEPDGLTDGAEIEMPEDDTLEPLGPVIDLEAVMAEAVSLALPAYPRKDGVDIGEAQFAEPGVKPMQDGDLKPFAGLAGLRDKLSGGDSTN